MDTLDLLMPMLEGGIRNTNFFNGRLLSAEDLQVEQHANRQHHQQLGQALGAGVVHGMEASLMASASSSLAPIVSIKQGLALNRHGQALALPSDVALALVRQSDAVAASAGLFAACESPQTTGTGAGIYLLIVSPVSGFKERAPMIGLGTNGEITACGSRYAVEGVQFRLVRLDTDTIAGVSDTTRNQLKTLLTTHDAASLSKLRNMLAHLCFGTEELTAFPFNPFGRMMDGQSVYARYGAFDGLQDQKILTACDVPLAVLYWTTGGIQFVDMWAARRRPVQPLLGDLWPLHVGQRRSAEAEAIFLQFQHHLHTIQLREPILSAIKATSYFRYLPPAGYLPIGVHEFNRNTFFHGLEAESLTADAAFLRLLMHQSWYLEPIDLTNPPPMRLYSVPESPDYLLFVRHERPQATSVVPEGPGQPDMTSRSGRIIIDLVAGEEGQVLPTFQTKRREGLDMKVWAEDQLGNPYQAKFVETTSHVSFGQGRDVTFVRGKARFEIPALPAGAYTVKVQMTGFKNATQRRTVQAGQTLHVVFRLVPETKKPGGKTERPKGSSKGTWITPGWYGKISVIEAYLDWPWPPEQWLYPDPVIDPFPPEVEVWLKEWSDWLSVRYPEAPVDPGEILFYINPAHTPDVISQEPYAYMVFGDSGAYAPVILTPNDHTLDRPVAIAKGELVGIERDLETRLNAAGLTELDVLSASWAGLIAHVMEVNTETANSVITEARDQTEVLQDSLRIFSGVDTAVEAALKGMGINDAVDLANANPQTIVTGVQSAGGKMTTAFAQRLVDEARRTVPTSAWSLAALGLKESEITTLQARGIISQGTLVAKADDAAGRIEIETALGATAGTAGALATRATASKTSVLVTRKAAVPVTRLVGVNQNTARALAERGLGTMGALSTADVSLVTSALGGDAVRAAALINAAKAGIP